MLYYLLLLPVPELTWKILTAHKLIVHSLNVKKSKIACPEVSKLSKDVCNVGDARIVHTCGQSEHFMKCLHVDNVDLFPFPTVVFILSQNVPNPTKCKRTVILMGDPGARMHSSYACHIWLVRHYIWLVGWMGISLSRTVMTPVMFYLLSLY
jgi:hypothetical protein